MELTGSQNIMRDRAGVWAALNEPAVLQQCIPGCESLVADGDNNFRIVLMAAVGPVKARFNGKLLLSDIREQEGYSLTFEGSGGAAGFGKGGAQVSLENTSGGTLLIYKANAKVGGKLAQVGSRLIDGVAAKMADEFFGRFKAAVEKEATAGAADVATPTIAHGIDSAATNSETGIARSVSDAATKPFFNVSSVALLIVVAVVAYCLGRFG